MDICIIAPPWLPVPAPAYGGTEAVLDALARGLQRAGHHVRLIAHPDSTCPVERCSVVPADDTEPMGRGVIELEHVVGAYELARGADVVHDHTMAGPLYAQHLPDLPIVTTNHGPFNRTNEALYRAMTPRVGIVAISASQASTTTLPIETVVHHGVDLVDYPDGDGRGGYVLFLGRMAYEKGVHRAIDAARAAGLPILIAAKMREPGEHTYYETVVRPRLGSDAVYLGEVDCETKLALLAGASALVNPIRWPEPFGMVMLESLACGTPVVGHPMGAAPEIVEDGVSGLLVRDPLELTDALKRIGDIDRAACRERARAFSVERMAFGYLRVFYRRRRQTLRRLGLPVVRAAASGT